MGVNEKDKSGGRKHIKVSTNIRKTGAVFKKYIKAIAGSTKFESFNLCLSHIPYDLLNKYC
jgi:hypothetical protein